MFRDRADAGRLLAEALRREGVDRPPGSSTVLALPRGGVPVGREVASALGAPLEVVVVRKIGAARNPEYAVGALGEGGVRVIDEELASRTGTTGADLERIKRIEAVELDRRVAAYRRGALPDLSGRTAIIVDDGLATGATARAACLVARAWGAHRVVLGMPVAPRDWISRLAGAADAYIAVETPEAFFAVGQAYADFRQLQDDEVARILDAGGTG